MAKTIEKLITVVEINNVTVDKGKLNKETIPERLLLEVDYPPIKYEDSKNIETLNVYLSELIEEELMHHLEVDRIDYSLDVIDYDIINLETVVGGDGLKVIGVRQGVSKQDSLFVRNIFIIHSHVVFELTDSMADAKIYASKSKELEDDFKLIKYEHGEKGFIVEIINYRKPKRELLY